MPGGLSLPHWVAMWWTCHEASGMGGMTRVAWPDEGSVASQPAVVVEMFAEIGAQVAKEQERMRQEQKARG